ncbi:hypothetical protein GCM10008965_52780 [Methylorubrum aminovorans]|nr:hypothetical protein GCM10025880_09340 [Methylorubrum aminovorans]
MDHKPEQLQKKIEVTSHPGHRMGAGHSLADHQAECLERAADLVGQADRHAHELSARTDLRHGSSPVPVETRSSDRIALRLATFRLILNPGRYQRMPSVPLPWGPRFRRLVKDYERYSAR